MTAKSIDFIAELEGIIRQRSTVAAEGSYTASLLAAGTKRIAQKVGEEGVELALAAVSQDRDEILNEAADLVYHVLVLLADQGLSLSDVARLLERRHQPL